MSKEFEIARLAMVRAVKAGEVDASRGLAWAHRIHPLNGGELEDAFASDFDVSAADVDSILKAIDSGWRNGQLVSFYDLERAFSSLSRMDIYHVCRAAFLDRRFDDSVWQALTTPGSGPIESQGMTKPFDLNMEIDY